MHSLFNLILITQLYNNLCLIDNIQNFPHELVSQHLYNIRNDKKTLCSYFRLFIILGYNPFRKNISDIEKLFLKNIFACINRYEKRYT